MLHRTLVEAKASDLAAAKVLLGDLDITVAEVARRVGVSPATLYRHLPGGRGALAKPMTGLAAEEDRA